MIFAINLKIYKHPIVTSPTIKPIARRPILLIVSGGSLFSLDKLIDSVEEKVSNGEEIKGRVKVAESLLLLLLLFLVIWVSRESMVVAERVVLEAVVSVVFEDKKDSKILGEILSFKQWL